MPASPQHSPTVPLAVDAARLPRHRLFATLALVVSGVAMLALNVPWQPVRGATIGLFDYSWMLVLHDALASGRQFGRELIVPYGPLGFVATNVYDPRTYLLLIAIRVVLALVALRLLWETANKAFNHPLAALPWMLAMIAMMGPAITSADTFDPASLGGVEDHFFSICALLVLASYFTVHDRHATPSVLAGVALLAAASLAKVNFLLQDLVVVAAITVDQFRRRTKQPWRVPATYILCLALFYLGARQSPASLPSFLWGWAQVSVGHMDAVGLPSLLIDLLAFLLVALLVLAMAARLEWKTRRWAGLVPALALAALFALLFKHSFVRQDFAHATIAPICVLAAAGLYAPFVWRQLPTLKDRALCLGAATLAVIVVASTLSEFTDRGLGAFALAAGERTAGFFPALAHNIADPSRLRAEWEQERAALRQAAPLPVAAIRGPTDVYPHRQAELFAYGLSYDPRPAFSSLFATAPALARLNADHLEGVAAPQTILFDIEPVDRQYPSLADAPSWPQLLARYDVVDASGAMLVLRRSPAPRAVAFSPLATLVGRLDQPIAIPDASAGPLWARIHLHRRLGGRLVSALYKPPMVQIEVQTRDGAVEQYRLLPAVAEQGFLLSPTIKTRRAFAQLAGRSWHSDPDHAMVERIALSVVDGSADLNYDSGYEIDLERLDLH